MIHVCANATMFKLSVIHVKLSFQYDFTNENNQNCKLNADSKYDLLQPQTKLLPTNFLNSTSNEKKFTVPAS